MSLTDEAKRQAMDAVSHRETTAMIRAYRDSGIEASPDSLFQKTQVPETEVRPIPDDVKRKAMDSLAHSETRSQIRLMQDDGEVRVPITPGKETPRFRDRGMEISKEHSQIEIPRERNNQEIHGREYA